ncbi:MAG: DUF4159 domain-containing protein [Gemmataceae bacterium]
MLRCFLFAPVVAVLGVLLLLPGESPAQPKAAAPAKPEDELVNKVRDTIKRGVTFLKNSTDKQSGNWEGIVLQFLADMEGGSTALVVLALLNCGEKPDDPQMARALDYLASLPARKTYVVGLQNMVFAEARRPKDLAIIQRNADWLIEKALGYQNGAGTLNGWSYPGNTLPDNSNTQYALLGLYAAKQAGAKIEDRHWKAIQEYYTRTQAQSGFWRYHNSTLQGGNDSASFTMSVAGVCGLVIAGMGLDQSEQQLDLATGVAANCGVYAEDGALARGMNWVASKFAFNQGKSNAYNIYGIERLGRLSGQRFIGKYDWYREGCVYLISKQEPSGAIKVGAGIDGSEILSTAFCLLFLSKGRTPVLISKFAWGDYRDAGGGTFREVSVGTKGEVNWNRKHNDTRHLVDFASRELFKGVPLSWQVYDMRRQNIETDEKLLEEVGVLLQSPVLYLNGHGKMPFVGQPGELLSVPEKILQKYVDEGGFLLAEACCGDEEFTASFRLLMKRIFPKNDLRRLPESHAIWTSFYKDEGLAQFAGLEGMEKGCRTVAVFSPKPLAGYWEEQRFMPKPGKAPAKPGDPNHRGEMSYKLAGNVIAYATGLELPKPKLTTTKIFDPKSDTGPTRGVFMVAQLQTVGGDADPAPAAMRNLMSHLREKTGLDVSLKKLEPPPFPGDDRLFNYKFMYLHGRKPFTLEAEGVESIKSNLQTGGLLFADAGCNGYDSWKKFDESFRANCKKLFPDSPLQVIPANDPLLSAKMNGAAIGTVRCRRERPDGKGPEAEMRGYAPYLEGVKVDGRWVIVYSKYDIGCALEGHKASDCMGHDRESALKLGSAVVLYSLKR